MAGLKFFFEGQWWDVGGTTGDLLLAWITIGTIGVDGVDALIAANPAPYAPAQSPGPIAFSHGTQPGGSFAPLQIAKLDKILLFSGGFTGVTTGQTIFVLPSPLRPAKTHPIYFPYSDFSGTGAVDVQSGGNVVFKGKVTQTFT